MKRILTAVFVLLASLTSTTVLAQGGYQVKGVVVDAVGPVIGAAVVQQGTTNGTSTGIDGDFVLNVPNGDAVIEISCIGYATQTFKASETPATITLEEDTHFLDEVVVIGYGTVKKSDLTGSVSTVKPDEVNKGVITSPADLIRGKSAGVVVTSGSGMPGSGATVRIRGGSSINASNDGHRELHRPQGCVRDRHLRFPRFQRRHRDHHQEGVEDRFFRSLGRR